MEMCCRLVYTVLQEEEGITAVLYHKRRREIKSRIHWAPWPPTARTSSRLGLSACQCPYGPRQALRSGEIQALAPRLQTPPRFC